MIPKVIHYCWFGNAPKPISVIKCIESWRKYCPDYEIREWTEKDFDITQNLYCKQAYEAGIWGFVPDYARLWIIYHYGGIYLDTDVQIIKSFDPLLDDTAFCGFEKSFSGEGKYYVNFGQGFGAEKRNPIIKAHLEMYNHLMFRLSDGSYNKTASPSYTTQLLVENGLDRTSDVLQKLAGITVYPHEYFCPKSFESGLTTITKNTYSIHHFDASWFSEEAKHQKEKQWKKEKREFYIDYIIHTPNRVVKCILGSKRYELLKQALKKGR